MWDLDDCERYTLVATVLLPFVYTYGNGDKEMREEIRERAQNQLPESLRNSKVGSNEWAFRIDGQLSSGHNACDTDNIPKLVIDSFCGRQIRQDQSRFADLNLFEDDNYLSVPMVQVCARATDGADKTTIEIFLVRKS